MQLPISLRLPILQFSFILFSSRVENSTSWLGIILIIKDLKDFTINIQVVHMLKIIMGILESKYSENFKAYKDKYENQEH